MSAQLQAITTALRKSLDHTLDAATESATIAAVLDGYRGDIWITLGTLPPGGFEIMVVRDQQDFAEIVASRMFAELDPPRVRRITVTEDGAKVLMQTINDVEGDGAPRGSSS